MEKIGRYQVVGELGRGAMGVVYRAVDPNIGRTVALKTMRLDIEGIQHHEMLQRFRNEARAAGLMNHPNIVTIHDADEYGGLFYIAMEYLEGETLQSLMMRKQIFSAEEIIALAKQVAAGLDYAHGMKVVHRDIKPANIMITSQSVAKIMDFGISKSIGTMTRTGQVLGTPYYMSPEQVMGRELDGRADLFSFGVVLYEMATGERPFTGENVTTIIYKIVNESPVPACQLQVGVHPGLSNAIAHCLAKKPEERYQSGAELAANLENFHSLQPVEDGQATTVLQARSGSRPQARASATAAGTATALKTVPLQPAAPTVVIAKSSVGLRENTKSRQKSTRVKKLAWTAVALFVLLLGTVNKAKRQKEAAHGKAVATARELPRRSVLQRPPETPKQAVEAAVTRSSEVQSTANAAQAQVLSASIPEKGKELQTPRRVSIRFTSNPEGASVRFDGHSNPTWKTPFTLDDVVPGPHQLIVAKDGYSTQTRELEIGSKISLLPYNLELVSAKTGVEKASNEVAEQRQAPVPQQLENAGNVPLRPSIPAGKGWVDFVTVPPGASIFIEGQRANATTPAHNVFPPGNYSIELRLPGYKPLQRTLHVEEGQVSTIQESLDPQ
ncbi:MAG TPA: serine/threonine-protein kinase [Terriglobales bacterium]|nr:serine/threonine-protein kinase [Terriglobales bacterium]